MSNAKTVMSQAANTWAGPTMIEDVFSTYLYTGTGSAQTITNGIDLAGKGGMVWHKHRSSAAYDHTIFDTERGTSQKLITNGSLLGTTETNYLTSFNSDGFSVGTDAAYNGSGGSFVTWTFRKEPRFFDVQTWSGDGALGRTIPHNLGVVPGCILVKSYAGSTSPNWNVYHRSNTSQPETDYLTLNSVSGTIDSPAPWNDTAPTDEVFSLGNATTTNASGYTYVAYLFAHDPLGPSGDGSDGLIACGGYTGDGTTNFSKEINLGWEAQWILVKNSASGEWMIFDDMRGLPDNTSYVPFLQANTSDNENDNTVGFSNRGLTHSASGFKIAGGTINSNSNNYIYIAIRRGPMRTPLSATDVFSVLSYTATNSDNRVFDFGIKVDTVMGRVRTYDTGLGFIIGNRYNALISSSYQLTDSLFTSAANPVRSDADSWALNKLGFQIQTGVLAGNDLYSLNYVTYNGIAYGFQRAPGFFDVVSYTGTGANQSISHNLGAAPKFMVVKERTTSNNWVCYFEALGNDQRIGLNASSAPATDTTAWQSTTPTDKLFYVGANTQTNVVGERFVAYLFGDVAGVSKIGTYTGTGAEQTIDCGFTGGARFVLTKTYAGTNPNADWNVWDSSRGITTGNDPILTLNKSTTEVTNYNVINPHPSGFTLTSETISNNAGTSYLYLAIA